MIAMASLPKLDDDVQYNIEEKDDGTMSANFSFDNLTLVSCLALHDPPKVGRALHYCQLA